MRFEKISFAKSIGKFSFPLLLLTFFSVSTLIDPLWFTNSKGYIDAWIYWGAGDNPILSYQSDFASTYYLQRYVVIFPKIVVFSIIGSFWGQMIVGLLWISIAFYYLFRISQRQLGNWCAFLLVLIFMSDPVLLGAFGSSYTMGPTIAFYSMFFFYLLNVSPTEEKKQNFRNIFLSGIAVACLLNVYLLHGLTTFGIATIYLLLVKALSILEFIKYFVGSSILVTVFFQVIYVIISGDWVPFILKQFYFGSNLALSPNSYGSNGFLDFWSKVLSSQLVYYWLAILISYIFVSLYSVRNGRFRSMTFKGIQVTSVLLLLAYLAQTFLYTNIFGYIWVACGLYHLKFIALLHLVLILKSLLSENTTVSILSTIVVWSLFIDRFPGLITSSQFIPIGTFSIGFMLTLLSGLSLIKSTSSFWATKRLAIGLASVLILALPTFSHAQNFREYSVPFEGTLDGARLHYAELTDRREIVLEISKSIKPTPRSWFTPDSSNSLVSSQLFLYSLISSTPGKANCSQVNWAGNYRSLIFSFGSQDLESSEVTKLYLADCGYEAVDLSLPIDLANNLKDVGGQVWELKLKE